MLTSLIQILSAAAVAAMSLLIQPSLSAAIVMPAPGTDAEPARAFVLTTTPSVDVVALGVPYAPTQWHRDLDRVFPKHLTAPAALKPTGSLTWAGIETVESTKPLWDPRDVRGSNLYDFVGQGSTVDLLTGRPAPEPPAIVMAGFALAAGAVWTGYRRRQKSPAEGGEIAGDATSHV
jgi:hypothetical protein